MPLRFFVCVCVCLHVCTHLECMWPSLCAGGEERRRENEHGGRVYAFSPSLLIINVSQVRKIASRSFCSILPSSSPFSGFPFSHSLCLLSTSLVLWATSPSPSQSFSKHSAQGGHAKEEMWIYLRGKWATRVQPTCPPWLCSPDQQCGQSWWQCAAITTGRCQAQSVIWYHCQWNFRHCKWLKCPCCGPCWWAACSRPVKFTHEIHHKFASILKAY